ncbi:MAG: hypothetical protein QTN59_19700 [Candidatus Electrothrix communis]|nr:MAG: hypothetical protein QTN59_19700 [Candidatus Electrothrix communis]
MKPYRNPESGITAYDIANDYMLIQFKGTKIYRYDESCVGAEHLAQMKIFAEEEDDLNTYINKNRHIHKCGKAV